MATLQSADYVVGIDGGGTKTEAVIGTPDGTVIGRGVAGGANVHNFSFKTIYANLALAVSNACANAAEAGHVVNPQAFASLCIGISGIDTIQDRQLMSAAYEQLPADKRLFQGLHTTICGDGLIGLLSGTNEPYGICLIASTGSNCFGITREGHEAAAGDWGYALGDLGSGFAIGSRMLSRVMKEYDGREPLTKLTPAVLAHLQLSSADQLVAWAYGQSLPVAEIASLTQILSLPEFSTFDDFSRYISTPVVELTQAYLAVVKRLSLESAAYPLVLVGGLFKSLPVFKETVVQLLGQLTPNAQIILPEQTPAFGALTLARMQYGH